MKEGLTMKEPWVVFFLDGKEICRYTVRGMFPGEREETIKLLASEHDVPISTIYFAVITA